MSSRTEILTQTDIVDIKKYQRYAVLMPTKVEDTIACLGYNDSSIESLTPESFNDLFFSINNNGRYWIQVEKIFKERFDAMSELHAKYGPGLLEALKLAEEMMDAPPEDPIDSAKVQQIYQAIHDYWYDLIYEEAKNQTTIEKLNQFKSQIVDNSAELDKKLDFIDAISNENIKSCLLKLTDDFKFMITFSTDAETGCQSLWTQWTMLSERIENLKEAAQNVSTHSDIVDLYIDLLGITNDLSKVDEETNYLKNCFYGADEEYSNFPAGLVPLGSYLDNCTDIRVILQGECETAGGSWKNTELDLTELDPLKTEVSNQDGQLVWENDYPIVWGYSYFPGGNYRDTSRSLQVKISAQCPNNTGQQTSTFELTNMLNVLLKNDNGKLVAET